MEDEAAEAIQKRQRLDRYAALINDFLKLVQIDSVVEILSYLDANEMYYIMSQHPADRNFAEDHNIWEKVAISKYRKNFQAKQRIFTDGGSVVPGGRKLNYLWMLLALWGAKNLITRQNNPFHTSNIEFSFNEDEVVFGMGLVSARHLDVIVKQNLNHVDIPALFDALQVEFGAESIASAYRFWRVDLRRNLDNYRSDEERLARLIYRLMLIRGVKLAHTLCLEEKRILIRENFDNFYH